MDVPAATATKSPASPIDVSSVVGNTAKQVRADLNPAGTVAKITPPVGAIDTTKTEPPKTEPPKTEPPKTEPPGATATAPAGKKITNPSSLTSALIPDKLLPGGNELDGKETDPPEKQIVEPPAPGSKEENMAALRQRVADQQKIIDDLSALKEKYISEDGEFKPPPDLVESIKDRDDRINKLSEELARVNFAASPEFQQRYQAPVDATFQQISELVKELGGKEGIAEYLAGIPVKQRLEYLKAEMPDATGVLVPMYSSLDQLLAMRQQALTDHAAIADKLKTQETVRKQQQIELLKTSMRDKAISTAEQQGYFMFSRVPGNDEWNQQVDKMREAVDVLVHSEDVGLQAEAMALSVAAPVYRNLYEEERAIRIDLEKQLQRYKTADPSLRMAGTASGNAGSPEVPAPGTSVEAIAKSIAGRIFQ